MKEIDSIPTGVAHPDGRTYSNATPDDKKPVDKDTPRCEGCSGYHGGVNLELNCLRAEIVRLRAESRAFRDEAIILRRELAK